MTDVEKDPDFSGKWRNQLGSEMELAVQADDRITGVFRSGVGAVDPHREFPLVGYRSGDVISFCVSFGRFGLAAWVGQHNAAAGGVEQITTMWHLAENVPEELERAWLWSGVKAGSDTFVR
jgi:hypothetical protein